MCGRFALTQTDEDKLVETFSLAGALPDLAQELQGKEIVLAKDLYAKADKAMYRAKSEGKNRINIVHL